jgi:exopolysaccharide biosynthesis polyprenyl glycosylphosphotransferase
VAPSTPLPSRGRPAASADLQSARRRRYARGRIRQGLLIGADIASLTLGFATAAITGFPSDNSLSLAVAGLLLPVWVVVLHVYALYPRVQRYVAASTLDELPRLFHAALVTFVVGWVALTALGGTGLGVPMSLVAVVTLLTAPVLRALARWTHVAMLGAERTMIVGQGSTTARVERALAARRDTDLVGRANLPDSWHRSSPSDDASTLGALTELVIDRHVDRVLLATHELSDSAVGEFLQWSRRADVSLTVLPEHFDVVGVGATIDQLQGASMISLQPPVLSRTARIFKRTLDIVGASAGLVALLPLMAVIATAIRVDSRGPMLFRQQRVGRGGQPFELLKFRTMVPDADALLETLMTRSTDPNWLQIEDDPRITRIGRFLRATSLDELPQLWNVLVGHMSLVGPRPLSVRDDARVNGWARGRLDITPGLTGLWQVSGRKLVPFDEMVKLDYLYVNNWSVWGDIKLLLMTLPAVIAGRGAR